MMQRTPQEIALHTLIHDHANAISLIGAYVSILLRELRNGNVNPEEIEKELLNMKRWCKQSNDALDAYYLKFKNDFK